MAFRPNKQLLEEFRSVAIKEYTQLAPLLKLRGEKTPATEEERRLLSYLRAALRVWVKEGAVKDQWVRDNETNDRE